MARSINLPNGALWAELFAISGADIRNIWAPDAGNFFGRIRTDQLDRIWAEMLELDSDDARRADFSKLKKVNKAKELASLFCDASVQEAHGLSRKQIAHIDAWLPEEMRAPST